MAFDGEKMFSMLFRKRIRIEMFSMRVRLTIASGVTSHTTDKRNIKKIKIRRRKKHEKCFLAS